MQVLIKPPGIPLGLLPHVVDFCRSISPEATPTYLVTLSSSEDLQLECFANASRHAKISGGRAVLGWRVWEHYGVMIEAEVHAVWQRLDKALQDVTPHSEPGNRILFLPDDGLSYDGTQINNIRRPLNSDPNVAEFIRLCDAEYELLNRGSRAGQHGQLTLVGDEASEYKALQRKKLLVSSAIYATMPMRNDLCRCGSGRKYKRCCMRYA
jgi:hypothetical protein